MKKNFLQLAKETFIVTLGCMIMAFNINYFFLGNKLAQGGVGGLSLIVHYLSHIDISYIYFGLNVPLIIVAYIFIGKEFVVKTLYATVVLTISLKIFGNFREPLDEILMASILGGALNGIGIGIVFYAGGSTGGTDIIAKIINKYYGIALGKVLLAMDFIILSLVAFIFGKIIFMYTFISLVVTAKIVDLIQEGIYSAKGVTIITNKTEELKNRIMQDVERGLTIINAQGAYTQRDVSMLYCVVGKYQLIKVKNIVKEVDPEAFMIVSHVHEVIGKGFLKQ